MVEIAGSLSAIVGNFGKGQIHVWMTVVMIVDSVRCTVSHTLVRKFILPYEWTDECVSVCIEGQQNGSSFRCMPEHTEVLMSERMNVWTYERMNVQTYEHLNVWTDCTLLFIVCRSERTRWRFSVHSTEIESSLPTVTPDSTITTSWNRLTQKEIALNLPIDVACNREAFAAKTKRIPLSIISESMEHNSQATTQIYPRQPWHLSRWPRQQSNLAILLLTHITPTASDLLGSEAYFCLATVTISW